MIIGFDAKRAFYNRTGLGNFSRWHIELMLKSCDEDEFVLFSPDPQRSNLFRPYHSQCRVQSTGNGLSGKFKRVFPADLIKKSGIQVYHGLSNELPLGKRWSAGIKTIMTVHDLIFMKFPELYDPVSRKIYQYKLFQSLKKADIIHCVSRATADDLKLYTGIGDDRIRVLPLGIGLVQQHLKAFDRNQGRREQKEQHGPILLCVSSMEKRKNLIRLTEAFCASSLHKDWKLVIAGKTGDTLHTLKQAIECSGQSARIELVENPESEHLRNWYLRASAFIYPSLYEGFGIPILEALSFGLPVLSSETSSLPEVGGKAAWYFDPQDTGEMTKVISCLNEEEKTQELTALGRQQLKNFEDQSIAEKWKSIYHSSF